MSDIAIAEIFSKLLEDLEFKNTYFWGFLDRFVYNATDLEGGLTPHKRKVAIEYLLEAFNYLMEKDYESLSPYDIIDVANIINKDTGIEGIRRINVSAGSYATWTPVNPKEIYPQLYNLIGNYSYGWIDRDIYEKEAHFHIMLMRIHPFEDGNKRTAKIIMNANLIKQNCPPVVITEWETEIYYNFINNNDFIGFANFLRAKSLDELKILMSSYKIAKGIPITDSIVNQLISKSPDGRK